MFFFLLIKCDENFVMSFKVLCSFYVLIKFFREGIGKDVIIEWMYFSGKGYYGMCVLLCRFGV